jgi:hypothetical protein
MPVQINYGSEGGLYAEQIYNRDFETLGRAKKIPEGTAGTTTVGKRSPTAATTTANFEADDRDAPALDPGEPAANQTSFAPWTAVGAAALRISTARPAFKTNPSTLLLNSTQTGDGARNPGFWGINVQPGANFTVSFYARTSRDGGNGGMKAITVQFVGSHVAVATASAAAASSTRAVLGSTTVNVSSSLGAWQQFSVTVQIPANATATPNAAFELIAGSSGSVWFDAVSAIPGDAVGGLWRRDIFDKIAGSVDICNVLLFCLVCLRVMFSSWVEFLIKEAGRTRNSMFDNLLNESKGERTPGGRWALDSDCAKTTTSSNHSVSVELLGSNQVLSGCREGTTWKAQGSGHGGIGRPP